MAILYFAYGSNMDSDQMKERCPDSKLIGKANLPVYRLDFTRFSKGWGGGVADIVINDNSTVWGLLFEVSDKDLDILDKYEGHPFIYVRFEVNVIKEDSEIVMAYTYEIVSKTEFTPPTAKYINIIKKTSRDYNFPSDYQEFLETFESI